MSKVVFLDPIDHVSVANVLLRTPLLSWHASTSSLLSHALPLL